MPKGEQCEADAVSPRAGTAENGGEKQLNMEDIIGFEALWESMMKCRRGVIWKDSVAHFVLNGIREVAKLQEELETGTYKERPHKYFTVTAPKRREIMSISFRDRVYQRSLNDVAIYPAMASGLIYDNAACQKGKGADFARNRFKTHLQKYYRKNGNTGYCLKMDIEGYYPNMRHDVVKDMFRRHLDPKVYEMAAKILDGFPGDTGFNPGSQIIQIAGISVLNDLDHFIKERLRAKHYVRYMDDMLILGESRQELERIWQEIEKKLEEIGFRLHPKKTKILNLKDGVAYLGFTYRLTETGKVIMAIDPKRVKAERKKLLRMARLVKEGKRSREKIDQCYLSWRNHAEKGNSWHMLQKMDNYYRNLWR